MADALALTGTPPAPLAARKLEGKPLDKVGAVAVWCWSYCSNCMCINGTLAQSENFGYLEQSFGATISEYQALNSSSGPFRPSKQRCLT
eukprot:scaffold266562_cov19-Tisochrysis_lutea.AAC.2